MRIISYLCAFLILLIAFSAVAGTFGNYERRPNIDTYRVRGMGPQYPVVKANYPPALPIATRPITTHGAAPGLGGGHNVYNYGAAAGRPAFTTKLSAGPQYAVFAGGNKQQQNSQNSQSSNAYRRHAAMARPGSY